MIEHRLLSDRDALDLEQDVERESGDFDARSRGLVRAEELGVHGVRTRELVHVLQKNLRAAKTKSKKNLCDLVDGAPAGLDDNLEVGECLFCLCLDLALDNLHRRRVHRHAAGHEDEVPGLDCLRVGADGARGLCSKGKVRVRPSKIGFREGQRSLDEETTESDMVRFCDRFSTLENGGASRGVLKVKAKARRLGCRNCALAAISHIARLKVQARLCDSAIFGLLVPMTSGLAIWLLQVTTAMISTPFEWTYFVSELVAFCCQLPFIPLLFVFRLLDVRIGILPKSASTRYARTIQMPSSKNTWRRISVHVYEPPMYEPGRTPLPVHVNFHGSGFVLPCHGSDAELCAYWAMTLGCIVLDADYAKAPLYPHPSAIDDALDVLAYVVSQPDVFDLSKLTLGGFSAGANVAILAALQAPKDVVDIKAIVAWYPPTNLARVGVAKAATWSILSWIHKALRQSYLPPGINREDAYVSPLFAQSSLFPPITLIVGEDDKLLMDSVDLANKLTADGKDCVLYTVPGANHAWERFVKVGTPLWTARKDALDLVEKRLRESVNL
ncbi:hypothetical protein EW145_g5202 [Phellinidium pouzarii]|uniref:Alpha/beta hydrolase fold-3 domain-containing protein n=1 Tax=Phellinidium pouzarii TaxID=167371 RepID=A0A4V3XC84_9AGAM|nr:hypothetical protein EW145_g5202 [Phellinidium pouzarii]